MQPWLVDAADMHHRDEGNAVPNIMHSNRLIEKYLDKANSGELIVIATKGFGKTLLLQRKRLQLERMRSSEPRRAGHAGIHILPENALVERPASTPNILSYDTIKTMLTTADFWKNTWLITIAVATLKHYGIELKLSADLLRSIYDDDAVESVFDIFDRIIGANKNEIMKCYQDLRSSLVPEFRRLHTATYLFIDNVDEYFAGFIRPSKLSMAGATDSKLWYLSQYGLVLAAREFSSINSHVKICAAVRKEILGQPDLYADTMAQIRNRMLELRYSRDDLLQILKNNINAEKPTNLASPSGAEEFGRFFGVDSATLVHPMTGEPELVEDYVLRHTLGRPRDLVTIGRKISEIPPERRNATTIANSVNHTARHISDDYIGEITPHLKYFDPELVRAIITRNIIRSDEMHELSRRYDEALAGQTGERPPGGAHIFCNLYRVGLIGVLREAREGELLRQEFAAPGDVDMTQDRVLPESPYYLVHPILDEYIALKNPAYWTTMDKTNIVGQERVWRSEDDLYFVVSGGLCDFSGIAEKPAAAERARDILTRALRQFSERVRFCEVNGYDSFVLVDRNINSIWGAVRGMAAALKGSDLGLKARFGCDAGILISDGDEGGRLHGKSAIVSSRLETLSEPNQLLLTDAFALRAADQNMDIFYRNPVVVRKRRDIPVISGKFNIAKKGDSPLLVTLFSFKVPV